MQEFYFEAADQEGKKLSGLVTAVSEAEAREKLKQRKLAVFSVVPKENRPLKINDDGERLHAYEFAGIDIQGKPVEGRINATDQGAAYKSLVVEYEFELEYLVRSDLPDDKKALQKIKGISLELSEWLKKELKYSGYYKKKKIERERRRNRETEVSLNPEQQKELVLVRKQILEVTKATATLLKENEEFLNRNKRREIEDRLNLLSRLRQSNALGHLKSLTTKLIKQLADDTIFLEEADLIEDEEGNIALAEAKSKFKTVATGFDNQLKKELSQISITIDLEAVDPAVIKAKIVKAHVPTQIANTIYYAFFFLFFIAVCFWLFRFIQYFVIEDEAIRERILFYFYSPRLWQLTLFSGVISVGFVPFFISNRQYKTRERLLYFMGMFSLLFLLFFQFHAIFVWTV